MIENELNYYEKLGDWDFSHIKYHSEYKSDWEFFAQIQAHTNATSLCLDIGTGGGEKVLTRYPKVGMVIATDYSSEMIKTANENLKRYPEKRVKFAWMDNLNMTFPAETFDLVSARHTVIDAKQIYDCLKEGGVLVIEGVDKEDCWDIKEIFGRGQDYNDEIAISEQDYNDLVEAGFKQIEKVEIIENEYYEIEDDLMALLLKTPIINSFTKVDNVSFVKKNVIEKELFDEYVKQFRSERGILLKRKLYGIVAKKA